MWLRELLSLRHRLEEAEAAGGRARAEPEDAGAWRIERERLTQRVTELERHLAARDEMLLAKEQTLADLRRMILLLTPSPSPTSAAPAPAMERMPVVAPLAPLAMEPPPPRARPKTGEQLFGNHTMQLAHHLLETLGPEEPLSKSEHRPVSREIRFGPLDEFAAGQASTPPPVPQGQLAPTSVFTATPPPVMPKAGARVTAAARAPAGGPPLQTSPERPGTLVISEDMFNDVLAEDLDPGHPGRK